VRSLVKALDKIVGWVTAGVLAVTFALLTYGVITRYVFKISGLSWAFEVTIFAIAWTLLLSVSRVEYRNAHIRMDVILRRLGPHSQWYAELLAIAVGMMLSAFFVYSGYFVVADSIAWNERSGSSLRLPMWVYFSALSVSFSLHFIFLLARAMQLISSGKVSESEDLAATRDG
jgi:TRAP-type C4-dicarboxylate transport system permease small subunit